MINRVLEFQSDAGYRIRRSRYTRSWRRYSLEWVGIPGIHKNAIQDYVERGVQGGAHTFSWTNPRAHTITTVTPGTPVSVTCALGGHGVQTNDQVMIAGVGGTVINGTWTVTWVDGLTVTLNGSSSGVAWSGGGTLAVHHPNMMLELAEDTFQSPERLIGPDRNNEGVFTVRLTFLEVF